MKRFTVRLSLLIVISVFAFFISAIAYAGGKGGPPLIINEQASFFVGGTSVTAPGTSDLTRYLPAPDDGQTFQIDSLYAQYQVPPEKRTYPIIFVHGAGQTGKTWESTPDGREGFQSIFLREGYKVFIVDFPRRGRAGFPSFNGPLGNMKGTALVPDVTTRFGNEEAFTLFRLGARFNEYFPNSVFPKAGLDQFLRQIVPYVEDNPAVVSDALAALLEKTGPAILVTHSQSGLFGLLTTIKSPNVKGIVLYEPIWFVFPDSKVPNTTPLYSGVTYSAGIGVPSVVFQKLTQTPIQIVYGDNIPAKPTPLIPLDTWRVQQHSAEDFVAAVNAAGGDASVLKLPEAGLVGNTHFPFSDLNNQAVAGLLLRFLKDKGLDKREQSSNHAAPARAAKKGGKPGSAHVQ